jgi:hypothetical protein
MVKSQFFLPRLRKTTKTAKTLGSTLDLLLNLEGEIHTNTAGRLTNLLGDYFSAAPQRGLVVVRLPFGRSSRHLYYEYYSGVDETC